jgi:hypothetical protein
MIIFKTEHGSWEQRPPESDTESCTGKVLVRRNIRQETVADGERMEWVCEMAMMTYEEFAVYSQAQALEKQDAIDETLAEILLNQLEV